MKVINNKNAASVLAQFNAYSSAINNDDLVGVSTDGLVFVWSVTRNVEWMVTQNEPISETNEMKLKKMLVFAANKNGIPQTTVKDFLSVMPTANNLKILKRQKSIKKLLA